VGNVEIFEQQAVTVAGKNVSTNLRTQLVAATLMTSARMSASDPKRTVKFI